MRRSWPLSQDHYVSRVVAAGRLKGGFPYLLRRPFTARKIGGRLITHRAHRRFSAKSSNIRPITIVMIPGPGIAGTDMMKPSTTRMAPRTFFSTTRVRRRSGWAFQHQVTVGAVDEIARRQLHQHDPDDDDSSHSADDREREPYEQVGLNRSVHVSALLALMHASGGHSWARR